MAKWNQEIQNVDYRMGELKNQEGTHFYFNINLHKPIRIISFIIPFKFQI
jgi:hypothetical protein